VLIYSALGLHEEAVNLALQVDIKLAKEHGSYYCCCLITDIVVRNSLCCSLADKPDDNDELRKRLWLAIARHVVQVHRLACTQTTP
jgi:hypothetical protein